MERQFDDLYAQLAADYSHYITEIYLESHRVLKGNKVPDETNIAAKMV